MLETIMKHGIILYVMGILMAAGVLAKIISYVTARKLVKAAGDMQKSNQRLMRLIKAKFEHASMVSDKVQNVEAFVQKYLYEYKVLGARLDTWRTFPMKVSWLITAFGVLGVLLSYQTGRAAEEMFRYGAFAAIYAVVLISIHILSDEKTKVYAAKNYMIEYLENVCARRYEKAGQTIRPVKEEDMVEKALVQADEAQEEEIKEEMKDEVRDEAEEIEIQIAEHEPEPEREDEQEMRFRAILEEFLA